MSMIARGQAFVAGLRELAGRQAKDWRRCPWCGSELTSRWGSYTRRPWTFTGRQVVVVPRHRCGVCRRTYSETSPWLVWKGWYAREVRRCAIDGWQHGGGSLRRTAEWLRSWLGRQERWQVWRPLDPEPVAAARCWLSASTVHRWVDAAGETARANSAQAWAGVPTSGQVGVDGLWARLLKGTKRVVLGLVDGVSGLLWPPVVAASETAEAWVRLGEQAIAAGLERDALRGVVSDGASGIVQWLATALPWVNHQTCVFHRWQRLGDLLQVHATQAATGLNGAVADAVRRQARRTLAALVRAVFDAPSATAGQVALTALAARPEGVALAARLDTTLDATFVHQLAYNQGLARIAPEFLWRDFRLRLSRGRNHRSATRLERAACLFAVYRHFRPAQWRQERRRHYRAPGRSPLDVAGVPPGTISYLDALAV